MEKVREALKNPIVRDALQALLCKPVYVATAGAVLSWFVGYIGFSFMWLWIIIYACLLTEKYLVGRLVRKEVATAMEERRNRLQPSHESVEWINELTLKVYQNYGKFISNLIIEKATPIMKEKKPAGVNDIGFKKVDLGNRPPRLSNFMVHRTEPGIIMLDCEVQYHSDFEIVVYASTGIAVPLRVSDLTFEAKFRFTVTTKPNAEPFIKTVKIQILDRPTVDICVSPMGAVDVMGIPIAESWIKGLVENQMVEALHYPKFIEVTIPDEGGVQAEVKDEIEEKGFSVMSAPGAVLGAGVGALKSVGGMGLDATSAVGNFGVSTVKGVGNLGVSAVKGGTGAVKNIGSLGVKGISKVGSSVGINKKKEKDDSLIENEHENNAEGADGLKVPASSSVSDSKSPRKGGLLDSVNPFSSKKEKSAKKDSSKEKKEKDKENDVKEKKESSRKEGKEKENKGRNREKKSKKEDENNENKE